MRSRTASLIGLVVLVLIALVVPAAVATDDQNVQSTVSFGQWQTDPPLDRFTNPNDRTRNEHVLIPREVKIKAGGAVNFIISGFHEPTIYDAGTQPGDINTSLLEPGSDPPGLIADPHRRIFRGIDPGKQPVLPGTVPAGQMNQDRVESVRFSKPGRYLVICAVHPHFVNDGMFGFVKVTAQDRDD